MGINNLYIKEWDTVFIVPQKVGSTSIKTALRKSFDINLKDGKKWEKTLDIPLSDITCQYVVAFVRNPFDRLVSCYFNQVKGKKEYFKDKGLDKNSSFSEFVTFVTDTPHEEADRHFRPQYMNMFHDNKFIPDTLIHIENISSFWTFLQIKHQTFPHKLAALPHENKTIDRVHWTKYYTLELLDSVYDYYHKDFLWFRY